MSSIRLLPLLLLLPLLFLGFTAYRQQGSLESLEEQVYALKLQVENLQKSDRTQLLFKVDEQKSMNSSFRHLGKQSETLELQVQESRSALHNLDLRLYLLESKVDRELRSR